MSERDGFTLWFTGLSGAGKTTIAEIVGPELERRGLLIEYLDGDIVRTHLSKGLGFSKEDRDTNIERIGWVASRSTRAGVVTLVSAISPYIETRATARAMVEEFGPPSSRSSWTPRSRSARAATSRASRRGLRGGDQGVHGRQRPLRAAAEPGPPHPHRGGVGRGQRRARPRGVGGPRLGRPRGDRVASRQGRPPPPHPSPPTARSSRGAWSTWPPAAASPSWRSRTTTPPRRRRRGAPRGARAGVRVVPAIELSVGRPRAR